MKFLCNFYKTAFHLAVEEGDKKIVQLLLSKNIYVNFPEILKRIFQ